MRIFHPIVGDTTHGDGKQNTFLRKQFGLSRLMLHAKAIGFQHPIAGDAIVIEAGVPKDFVLMLEHLDLAGSLWPTQWPRWWQAIDLNV